MNNTYLAHHGILGMKWGVRRSEAQLARARGHSSKSSDDKNEVSARKAAVKNRRTMSDADLKKKIERLKLEREFKNLTEDDIAPGRKYVSEILSASGKKALTVAAAGAMTYAVKTATILLNAVMMYDALVMTHTMQRNLLNVGQVKMDHSE